MRRLSNRAHPSRRLTILSLVALTLLLFANNSTLSALAQDAKAGWRVELEEGKTTRSTLTIANRCAEPHIFRVKNSAKYLHFEQPTNSILIGPGAAQPLGVTFEAGRKVKVYRDKVIVECLDCKKSRGCHQDRDKVPVEMAVLTSSSPADASALSPNKKWGIHRHLVVTKKSVSCAAPASNCFDDVVVTGRLMDTWQSFDLAIDRHTTASFFSGKEWKLLFPNLDKFPVQLGMLRGGLPLLRFEDKREAVVRYLATRQTREQIVYQMGGTNSAPVSGIEFCLSIRPKQ